MIKKVENCFIKEEDIKSSTKIESDNEDDL